MQWKSGLSNFFLGISLGILIGVGFFLFKVNDLFTAIKEQLLQQKFSVFEKKHSDSTASSPGEKNKSVNPFKINIKNVSVNYRHIDSQIQIKDSSDFIIAEEKMEMTRTIRVVCLPPDSAELSEPMELRIEYLTSPLNTRGYIFTPHVLKLYGINSSYIPEVFCYKNRFFLRLWDELYELYPGGTEHKSFVKAPQEEIKKFFQGDL